MPDIVVHLRSQPRYGDQVVAFPTLFHLKTRWPDARLRVVSRYDVRRYYDDLPWVDEFVQASTFRQHLHSLPRSSRMSVSLHHSSERYGLVNLLRRPSMRLGFDNGRIFDFVWTHSHTKTIKEYIGLANLKMLSEVEPIDALATARRCFTTIASPARTLIAPADIVFIPGGGSGAFKRWAWQHYVRLADLLKKSLGNSTTFTFVLGPDEKPEREHLRALHRGDFRLEFGRSIPELARLMLSARLVVSNDCGPSHIAQGACVPYVGIFNAPNSEWFWQRPYARDVTPDNGTEDINTIAPERVLPSCLTLLGEQPAH